jgi:hypothetical protein
VLWKSPGERDHGRKVTLLLLEPGDALEPLQLRLVCEPDPEPPAGVLQEAVRSVFRVEQAKTASCDGPLVEAGQRRLPRR